MPNNEIAFSSMRCAVPWKARSRPSGALAVASVVIPDDAARLRRGPARQKLGRAGHLARSAQLADPTAGMT
ncbi:MAG: hypothetical protein Q4B12_01680 [Bowdeniella nasicola]|nr:hypothetical protein [Bowdeniella nasicola]